MITSLRLQIAVSTAALAFIVAAEGAAFLLHVAPGSETLWFINLKVFGSLHPGLNALSGKLGLQGFGLIAACGVLALGAAAAFMRRSAFASAFICHLMMFAFAAFAERWSAYSSKAEVASLRFVVLDAGSGLSLVGLIWIALLTAALSAHWTYIKPAITKT